MSSTEQAGDPTPPPMDHTVGGRKACQYSPAMGRIILQRIADGCSVVAIAADPAMPSYRTIYDWRGRHRDFGAAWDAIRACRAADRRTQVEQHEIDAARAREARAPANGRPARRKAGRKSTYTPQAGRRCCELLLSGLSLRAVARQPGMPSPPMVYRWLRNHPDFRAAYVAALDERVDRLEFEVMLQVDVSTPADFAAIRARVKRLETRIANLRPLIWRAAPADPQTSQQPTETSHAR